MNRIVKLKCSIRLYILSLLAMVSNITNVYAFEVDGLYYNIISDNQVEVTFSTIGSYSGNLIIPESVTYNDIFYHVTSIGSNAFKDCSGLTGSLTIPNSVTSIGRGAFENCSGLTGSLTIPNSVVSIGDYAFYNCSGFSGSLTIPNSIVSIGTSVFGFCSGFTGSLIIPNSVVSIGDDAFSNCSGFTGSLTIPNSVTSIGKYAFSLCSGLTGQLILPNSLTILGEWAFALCGFTGDLTIPNSLSTIEQYTFTSCESISSVNISEGVSKIGDNAFENCGKISSFILPESLTSIGKYSFNQCFSLSTIKIPKNVSSIGDFAFRFCDKLESVISKIEVPFAISENVFPSPTSLNNIILYIPKGTKSAYNQYAGWTRNFSKILEEGEEDTATYSLSITSLGNGSASYGGETIRGTTKTYTVNEGTSAAITFTPDDGHRIKSLKVDGNAVTASTSYTVTVNANKTVEVEFEAVPPTTYTLSIKATGNGSASYGGETIRGTTKTYTVNKGTSAAITFTPDDGYRIKSLKVDGSFVTASTSYTATVNANTTVEVEFEAIPVTPSNYSLSITASGNGSISYGGEIIRGTTKNYTVTDGASATIKITPDNGYQIKSLKVNGSTVSSTNSYSVMINSDTTIEVEFEEIPETPDTPDTPDTSDTPVTPDTPDTPTSYTLSIKVYGNGSIEYNGETIRDVIQSYSVNEGDNVIMIFTPDSGNQVGSVIINGTSVVASDSYTISNIKEDTSVEVSFEEISEGLVITIDGVNYQVVSQDEHLLMLDVGDYSITLEVPEKVEFQGEEWTINGITEDALNNCEELAAIIWNLDIPFTAKVANPNLLLYVKDEAYAPAGIRNVVVNGFAKTITLTDAQSGNNFYCPSAFTTQSIIYTHNYSMKTGLNESKGWETIALPFDVQKVVHSSRGNIVPFSKWTTDNNTKPFWLYELSGAGFVEADGIKANTPYIISMPNNDLYENDYNLSGEVTFSALNAEVKKSDEIQKTTYGNNTFIPSFTCQNVDAGYYALNVNNDYEIYQGSANVGSKFIMNLRKIHPFEAYMTSASSTRSIEIIDGMTTGIRDIIDIQDSQKMLKVYDLSGRIVMKGSSIESIKQKLPAGVYIFNNKKMIIK